MSYDFAKGANPFDHSGDDNRPTFTEADQAIFSGIREADKQRRVAKPLDIFKIYPDYSQPRRVVPSSVRQHWNGLPNTVATLFQTWVREVALLRFDERRHRDLNDVEEELYHLIDGILQSEDVEQVERAESDALHPVEDALLKVVDLAASIRRDGLTNAITVVKYGDRYQLETGERRWLAYHLLYAHYDDKHWTKIPAVVVEQLDVWRQASENNVRDDLNAIAKARQFAILLMDLYRLEGVHFAPFDDVVTPGESDLPYYAQVADGDTFRIPRGKGQLLLNAMGLKNTRQLRDYRGLLKLPDIVWQIADDLNWSEYFIRDLRSEAGNDDAKLIQLTAHAAREQGYTVPTGTVYDDLLHDYTVPVGTVYDGDTAPTGTVSVGEPVVTDDDRKRMRKLSKLDRRIFAASEKEKRHVIEMIHQQREWLDYLELTLRRSMES